MPYTYDHPHPAVTADVVLFARDRRRLKVLLIKRARDPHAGRWALPGGFLDIDEELEACARRELLEETGIRAGKLQQLHTFGQVDRDQRERVITIVYCGMLLDGPVEPRAASDAREARWHGVTRLPPLAFDHRDIIRFAVTRLRQNRARPAPSKKTGARTGKTRGAGGGRGPKRRRTLSR